LLEDGLYRHLFVGRHGLAICLWQALSIEKHFVQIVTR